MPPNMNLLTWMTRAFITNEQCDNHVFGDFWIETENQGYYKKQNIKGLKICWMAFSQLQLLTMFNVNQQGAKHELVNMNYSCLTIVQHD